MDSINIKGLEVFAHHGVYRELECPWTEVRGGRIHAGVDPGGRQK